MQTTLLGFAIAIILALVVALVGPLVVDWDLYRDEFEVRRVLERNPDMGVPFGSAIFTDKVDLKVVYVCNPCANLQQLVNLYIESNQQLLARTMSIDALMRNARK